ncbi:MAG: polysaccharide biosynthesis tyrosine autokinase [Microbacteriaceae bacterium]|nr:MAG: polysaccharide biosynthesis tyrosine autokinase [Microbacteriaceae bacterium]
MELRDYIRVLRKGWILILVVMLVGVAAAAAYSIIKTPEYQATSKVFVSTQGGGTVQDLQSGNTFTQQRVQTYADLVSTPVVLLPVAAALRLNMTSDQLSKLVTATSPLNTTLIEITATSTSAKRAADIANAAGASLTTVVQGLETPTTADATSPVKLTRVQAAMVPTTPSSPIVPLNLALGLLVGFALGIGVAVLREALDNRIRNEHDVEVISDVPIVGGIAFDPKAASRPLIVQADPRSPRAESFRTLRTNLQFLNMEGTSRSFVITSSVPAEGKTTTAANLAITLADAGSRVLVVDADLRRPKLAEYMGLEGAAGLTDVLIGRAELVDVIQPWGTGSLYVLPAGKIPPNPSELLGSRIMVNLITLFEKEFDYVLFDAPPLLPVTDAAILGKNAGGALVVVSAGHTHKNQFKGSVAALANVDARVAGFIVTMLPTKGPDAYGYGRYGYGGTGYGYTEADIAATHMKNALGEKGGRGPKRRAAGGTRPAKV